MISNRLAVIVVGVLLCATGADAGSISIGLKEIGVDGGAITPNRRNNVGHTSHGSFSNVGVVGTTGVAPSAEGPQWLP
jgi:hypothetical protein